MATRLIEIYLSDEKRELIQQLLKDQHVHGVWHQSLSEGQSLVRVLMPAEGSEAVLDLLESHFSGDEGSRIIILPVEALVPSPTAANHQPPTEKNLIVPRRKADSQSSHISRAELYEDIGGTIRLSWIYLVLVILSSVVATVGLMRDSVSIIIGAMVIAPLLGPNVALSLATTLGDIPLALRAMRANAAGISAALVFSILFGLAFQVAPDIPEIAHRTQVSMADIVLALAAGVAGALAFTTGTSTSLIGVMVAVALLPPLVTSGMLLGAGYWQQALGAFLLTVTNIICVNLAGVVTFLAQGVQPRTWWEKDKARKATRIAIGLWASLLLVLVIVIFLPT